MRKWIGFMFWSLVGLWGGAAWADRPMPMILTDTWGNIQPGVTVYLGATLGNTDPTLTVTPYTSSSPYTLETPSSPRVRMFRVTGDTPSMVIAIIPANMRWRIRAYTYQNNTAGGSAFELYARFTTGSTRAYPICAWSGTGQAAFVSQQQPGPILTSANQTEIYYQTLASPGANAALSFAIEYGL